LGEVGCDLEDEVDAAINHNTLHLPEKFMKLGRRTFLRLAASAAALPVAPRAVCALDYPTRPVRLIVQFFPGSLGDITARVVAQWISNRLGQQIVVEDQPGAGGNLATAMVVRAPPDGYTLLQVTSSNAWNATLYHNLSFDFIRDLAPVACISQTPAVLVVNPSFPAGTVPEFIAYAKANPGKINMASGGIGTLPHVAAELFRAMTGVNFVHVPYSSSYLPDLLGGQVQASFSPIPTVREQIEAGTLRALAVTDIAPSLSLPRIPTLGEFVPGYQASAFIGVAAPRDTPAEIIDLLNDAINASLADPKIQAQLAQVGSVPTPMSRDEFGKFIVEYTENWGRVLRAAGIKVQ
jgi:tripartite-type tricarboxylate transporter receptor subunit TctC